MEKSLSYKDVYLVPEYSELESRSLADISVNFLGWHFRAPWVPSNMESVINEKIAYDLSQWGYFYIFHRFDKNKNDGERTLEFVRYMNSFSANLISISVGVGPEAKAVIDKISSERLRVDFITIDIAHGHHILAKEMIEYIKKTISKQHTYENDKPKAYQESIVFLYPKIIAGNVCTKQAVLDLEKWGADAVKVGIAGGHACSTKNMTGFHIPMFSCVKDICEKDKMEYWTFVGGHGSYCMPEPNISVPIIADGGIRENGDIPKALVAGATMVMAGGLFAACVDAPGENVWKSEERYNEQGIKEYRHIISHKKYYGSASAKQKGSHTHVEGFEIEIPCNGLTYSQKYSELDDSLKSAVSYSGGKDLTKFKNTKYIRA